MAAVVASQSLSMVVGKQLPVVDGDQDDQGHDDSKHLASRDGLGKQGAEVPQKPRRSKRRMYDEEVDKYKNYEEYLDSLISEEDHFYLEDDSMARIIAELGYRSSGDTLSRENFYKLKSRLSEKRFQAVKSASSEERKTRIIDQERLNAELAQLEQCGEKDWFLRGLRTRVLDCVKGQLHSILFLRTVLSDGKTVVSGHIDLEQRLLHDEASLLPYLSGERKLVPKIGDLTFRHWTRNFSELRSSALFDASVTSGRLLLKHKPSAFVIDTLRMPEGNLERTVAVGQEGSFECSGWTWIDRSNEGEDHFSRTHDVAAFLDIRRIC